LPGACESREHHVHPEDVALTAESLGGAKSLPRFTVIRNPYDQALSWFGHVVLRHHSDVSLAWQQQAFEDFLRGTAISWYFDRQLNPYLLSRGEQSGDVLPFTYQTDLTKTVGQIVGRSNFLNGTADRQGPVTKVGGLHRPNPKLLNATTTRLIEKRFPEDIKLWHQHARD
jgi:hypothetical protein